MSETSERLKALIFDSQRSYGELAAETGIPKSAIQRYATGETEKIPIDRVMILAKALGTTPQAILGWTTDDIPLGFQPLPPMVELPLVGRIACGEPITAEENIERNVNVPEAWGASFVLTCEGDSMEPRIKDGDLVAVRKQPEVDNGQIAAVRLENEATLKKVYLYPDRLELRPINPDYESIVLYGPDMRKATIEGLAVGLCRGL